MSWYKRAVRNLQTRRELDRVFTGQRQVSVALIEDTPGVGTNATVVLTAAAIGRMGAGDTVDFYGETFEKVTSGASGKEFTNVTGLTALLNALDDWGAAESTNITVTSALKGVKWNGHVATINILEDTTASGASDTEAYATLAAATLAVIANGDTIEFDGHVFTKAAQTAVAQNRFADQAGLIACFAEIAEWGAANSGGATVITAADTGAEFNDIDLIVTLYRTTASGTDATPGKKGVMRFDDTNLYIAVDDNTVGAAPNWKYVAWA